MPTFSQRSKQNRDELHPKLQILVDEAIKYVDFEIVEGHRPQKEQDESFRTGKSKVQWPNGKHNKVPAEAFDFVIKPINWNDRTGFAWFAGIIQGIAFIKGIKIRWGGNFNRDQIFTNDSFIDMPHIELDEN